ncbi:MAG TPA: serine hydrolase domain-containing protein [Streptosporangiaceae bacterium]|nr:serine hydrolase domain-containing protein [Streptosporangiaceae bacterium]
MAAADVDERWATRLHDLAAEEGVPGAALGVWADGQEVAVAHGVLNAETGVRATTDSLFQIGSITKVWTTTMIMQLIDEGRLSLDTTVDEVLPGVRVGPGDGGGEIAIRHLLTHTSGIDGDIFTDTGRGDECVERYVGELGVAARIFPPGAAYSYCNSGFVLLGRIIEVLDGRIWDASLRERLTGPLGLTRTVTLPEEAIRHRAATGHRERPRQDQPVSVWGLPRSVGPAGLITSNVDGVMAFARLHLDGGVTPDGTRLLSQASVEAMQQQRAEIPGSGDPAAVGLGWRLHRWGGRRIFGHDGGTIGQTAYLRIDPEARLIACLLTNSSQSQSLFQRLFSEVFGTYAGVTVPHGPGPADGPAIPGLERHAGHYQRASMRYDVSVRDGLLHMVSGPSDDREAFSDEEPHEFDLYPADVTGDNFVARWDDRQPWSLVVFGRLGDQAPYMFLGGRITPRVV